MVDFDLKKFDAPGSYEVEVKGKMTIHGVSKEITHKGSINVGETIGLASSFDITLSDYDVIVPNNYVKRISNTVNVTLKATFGRI